MNETRRQEPPDAWLALPADERKVGDTRFSDVFVLRLVCDRRALPDQTHTRRGCP